LKQISHIFLTEEVVRIGFGLGVVHQILALAVTLAYLAVASTYLAVTSTCLATFASPYLAAFVAYLVDRTCLVAACLVDHTYLLCLVVA